ncbi:MAG: DNA topoisomerase IB [Acidobacteria bacterium]|nr:DNA topoisomerase IB [Acidobacteriota bacterium]
MHPTASVPVKTTEAAIVRPPAAETVQAARSAGLHYVNDATPGIQRQKHGKSFRYVAPDGRVVRDKETLARIRSLVIPPAWTDVWICTDPLGHLQVTGRDARGRKQSRYHPQWREVRDETKYQHMLEFGRALPHIRRRVEKDMAKPGLAREKVLATIVRLMELTHIRIGNEEYARTNKSYGLTTMQNRHAKVKGESITFRFRGKSGVEHNVGVRDRRLSNVVKKCHDIPGQDLFQYLDENGECHRIGSADVNAYLQEISGDHFTAKDFRTWAGSVMACLLLCQTEAFESETQGKHNVVQAIKQVASHLGNTPSVCRKCYVHPSVLEHYMSGLLHKTVEVQVGGKQRSKYGLRSEELQLIKLLKRKA